MNIIRGSFYIIYTSWSFQNTVRVSWLDRVDHLKRESWQVAGFDFTQSSMLYTGYSSLVHPQPTVRILLLFNARDIFFFFFSYTFPYVFMFLK